jgi:hypothetical protein
MAENEQPATVSSTTCDDAPPQFSLRALLLLVAIVAGCLVLFRFAPFWAILLTGSVLLIALGLQRSFWPRFFVAGLIMVGANLLPLYVSWQAFDTDGYERVGWPFTFFERGGFKYHERLGLHWLLTDAIIAIAVAYAAAIALKNGWRAMVHNLRTWGLKDRT